MKKRNNKIIINITKALILTSIALLGFVIIHNFYPSMGHPPLPWDEHLKEDYIIPVFIIDFILFYINVLLTEDNVEEDISEIITLTPLKLANRLICYFSRLIAFHLLAIRDVSFQNAFSYMNQNIGLLIIMLWVYGCIFILKYYYDCKYIKQLNISNKDIAIYLIIFIIVRFFILIFTIIEDIDNSNIHSSIIINRMIIAFVLLLSTYFLDWIFFFKGNPLKTSNRKNT